MNIQERIKRQDKFYSEKTPNTFQCGITSQWADDEFSSQILNKAVKSFYSSHNERLPNKEECKVIVEKYVAYIRQYLKSKPEIDDDLVPTLNIHTDSGCKIAGIIDQKPKFLNDMFWLEPNMDYEEIERLKFNPDNEWVQCLTNIYRWLVYFCEGDYLSMPYTHRSPLDMSNAIRGTELFVEMYTEPDLVKFVLNKVVDIELSIQNLIYNEVKYDENCRTGIDGIALPPKSVWVNGDPVGLISREMMLEFDLPYTGRLFTSTGGGYFHNHTIGIHQVDQIAKIPGIYTEQIEKDFNVPTLEETIRKSEAERTRIVNASKLAPIQVFEVDPLEVDELLTMLKGGCFNLMINCENKDVNYNKICEKIKNFQ